MAQPARLRAKVSVDAFAILAPSLFKLANFSIAESRHKAKQPSQNLKDCTNHSALVCSEKSYRLLNMKAEGFEKIDHFFQGRVIGRGRGQFDDQTGGDDHRTHGGNHGFPI